MESMGLFRPFKWYRYFKRKSLLRKFKSIGRSFQFDPLSDILSPEYMEIGDNVFIGDSAYISAEIKIGNNVMFGPRAVILGGDHYFGVKGKSVRFLHPQRRENSYPIHVEDEVWFGANVVILKGVTVGMGAVIGAGSIITKSIPPYTIAVGNPCDPKKTIFDDEILLSHLMLLNYSKEFSQKIVARRRVELNQLGIKKLPTVDKSDRYWERCCDQEFTSEASTTDERDYPP